jgi:dimethylaniline monooxygenase (N-oxide forming) / hypotaurine monooxygenase
MSSASKKRVCVIGSGACGLVGIKECRAEGLDVVCYEKSRQSGGLWRYHEEHMDGMASVARYVKKNSYLLQILYMDRESLKIYFTFSGRP